MNIIRKIEFASVFTFIILFIIFVIRFLEEFDIYGGSNSIILNLSIFGCIISILVFFVVYVIKIVKEENKSLKLLWSIFPIVAIIFNCLCANGVIFDNLFLSIICIVLEVIMVGLYNLYMLSYYGKGNKMIFTVIIYNLIVLFFAIKWTGLAYIHHYYLGFLILVILVGYIEFIIRNIIKKNRCKK